MLVEYLKALHNYLKRLDTRVRNLERLEELRDSFQEKEFRIYLGVVIGNDSENYYDYSLDVYLLGQREPYVKVQPIATTGIKKPDLYSVVLVLQYSNEFFYLGQVEVDINKYFNEEIDIRLLDDELYLPRTKLVGSGIGLKDNLDILKDILDIPDEITDLSDIFSFRKNYMGIYNDVYSLRADLFLKTIRDWRIYLDSGEVIYTPFSFDEMTKKESFKVLNKRLDFSIHIVGGFFKVQSKDFLFLINNDDPLENRKPFSTGIKTFDYRSRNFYFINKKGIEIFKHLDEESDLTNLENEKSLYLGITKDYNTSNSGKIEILANKNDSNNQAGIEIKETQDIKVFNKEEEILLDYNNKVLKISVGSYVIKIDKNNDYLIIEKGNDLRIRLDGGDNKIKIKGDVEVDGKMNVKNDILSEGKITSKQDVLAQSGSSCVSLLSHTHPTSLPGNPTGTPILGGC